MHRSVHTGLALVGALALAACSSDSTSTSGTGKNTTADSGTSNGGNDGGSTTSKNVNGCSSYTDGTTITWGLSSTPPSTCLRVHKGGSVTWNGDFSSHPLKPKDGDSPNPITATSTGTSASFKFDNVGTFGFVCGFHSFMTGAIEVVP